MDKLHKINGCENPGRKMDVVFIHGLGGDAVGTWRHGDDESTSWPHWVGADFPDIGVWSLGYSASPSKWMRFVRRFIRGSRDGYAMALPDRARQVVDLMAHKGLGQRPLVLVGHSLGGLLAKQLLRYATGPGISSRHRAVAEATCALLFLGTPHTGAALATLADRFRTVFRTTVAIETLKAHDPHLRDLYDWYRHYAPSAGIATATYYETRGVAGGAITIVNETSSHPGVGNNPIPLGEDHLTLAKPLERDAQVCDALREIIRGIGAGPHPETPLPVPPVAAPTSVVAPPTVAMPTTVVVNLTQGGSTVPPPPPPRELPPRAEHYFGRGPERERLAQRLRERRNTAVVGPGGLGKTALAAEALHQIGVAALEKIYSDGSLYLDLYATHANRDAIWSRIANRIAGSSFLEHASPQVRAEEACRGKRLLLILEGCEEADGRDGRANLKELLSVIPAETVQLLLSRQVTQAVPAESITVREALAPDDAGTLLDTLSCGRVTGDDRGRLLDLLAGHPLALTWAGNLLARDDEHPDALLRDWTVAVLPPLTDPTNSTHTLHWLYDRSARGLDADTRAILTGAGLLAHAPIPLALLEVAIDGDGQTHRTRTSLRTLVCAGLMRIDAQPDHWQFAHVLAYRYSRDQVEDADKLALALAAHLSETLAVDCVRADQPEIRARVARSLDHAAILLRATPLTDEAGWQLIASPLLYDWQSQLLARGRSDLAQYALDAVEAWMGGQPAEDSRLLREYMALQILRGDLLVLQGDLQSARPQYEAALVIAQRLAEADPGNERRQRDLSVSLVKLGDVQSDQGDLRGARSHYEAGLTIAQQMAETNPGNAQRQRDLSITFDKLGDVHSAQGDLPDALSRYEAGLAIAKRLAEANPNNTEWQRDLSVSFDKVGNVQSDLHSLPAARTSYEAGLVIVRRLAEGDPGNTIWQRDLFVSFTKLGNVHMAQGKYPDAQTHYEAALALAKRLAEADLGNAYWQRDLSASLSKLGDVQSAQGDLLGARTRHEAALAIQQRLADANPGNVKWQRDISYLQTQLAIACENAGDVPAAFSYAKASLEIDLRLAALDPTNAIFRGDVEVSRRQVERMRQRLRDEG